MATKELKTRISLKYDSYTNWLDESKGANLVLLPGEVGICTIGDTEETGKGQATTNPTVLFKVGDGETSFKELKWASALAADVHSWAKKPEEEFISWLNTEAKFATDEDISGLAARIAEIEGALGKNSTEGSVLARLSALETATEEITKKDGSIDTAKAAAIAEAKSYTDAEKASLKSALEAADAELTGALAGEIIARTEAIEDINTTIGGINTTISGIQSDISTNVGAIADNASDIDTLEAATADITGRLETVEAFFKTKEDETLDDALDTLKEIQDYLNGEEGAATKGIISRVAANETAIENISGRLDEAEDTIDAVEADIAEINNATSGILATAKGYAETKIADKAAEIKTAYEAYANQAESDAIVSAKSYTDEVKSALDAKDAALTESISANSESIATNATAISQLTQDIVGINNAIGSGFNKDNTVAKAIGDANTAVGTVAADVAGLTTRVGTAEGNITTLQGIVETGNNSNSKLRSDLTTLANKVNAEGTGLEATKAIADQNKADIAERVKYDDALILNCGSSTTVIHQ